MNTSVLVTASNALMMTAVVAIIDLADRKISYANAGHNYPYLYRASNKSLIKLDNTGGFPLGFEPGSKYDEVEVEFLENDRLLLYTDGIVEARNNNEEEFGYDRLEAYLQNQLSGHPEHTRQGLIETVREFTGVCDFEDDVTVLIVADETEKISILQ
jgi:serine phosphatase RsbU (regulator of sigma subunit)